MTLRFGTVIQTMREEANWSRRQLAQQTELENGTGGLTDKIIQNLENGDTAPNEYNVEALARAFCLNEISKCEFWEAAFPSYRPNIPSINRERIKKYLQDLAVPAAIYTPLADLVAFNTYFAKLYRFTDKTIELLKSGEIASNILRVYFDTELMSPELYDGDMSEITERSIKIFRTISLRYKGTPRYNQLLDFFREVPQFMRYWLLTDIRGSEESSVHIDPIITVHHPESVMSFVKQDIPQAYLGQDIHVFSHVPTYESRNSFFEFSSAITNNEVVEFHIPEVWYERFEVATTND